MLPLILRSLPFGYALGRVFTRLFSSSRSSGMPLTPWVPNRYPFTKRSECVDVYRSASRGEISVADPYQWLENDSEERDEWTMAQEAFTREYLNKNPDHERLKDAFRDCVDYPKVRKYPKSSKHTELQSNDCF